MGRTAYISDISSKKVHIHITILFGTETGFDNLLPARSEYTLHFGNGNVRKFVH